MKEKPSTPASSLGLLATAVEFPVTICVLCYGANAPLAERFLRSLYTHTDPALFHLRAGLNEVEAETRRLFEEYAGRFGNIDLYVESKNIFKNPLMRRLFHESPPRTRWTLWCDDDTHFVRPDWLQRLALKIERFPETAMWSMIHRLWRRDEGIREWIRQAAWFRGRPFMQGTDMTGEPATEFRFAPGAFWALQTEVLRQLDWPDRRLIHADEDFVLGEALRQNGLQIGNFKYGVKINDADRRNAHAPEVSRPLVTKD